MLHSNVLFIMFFLQGVQIPCPKEHAGVSDKLPEILPTKLRKQGLYLFLGKPQLDMRTSDCSSLQALTSLTRNIEKGLLQLQRKMRHVIFGAEVLESRCAWHMVRMDFLLVE